MELVRVSSGARGPAWGCTLSHHSVQLTDQSRDGGEASKLAWGSCQTHRILEGAEERDGGDGPYVWSRWLGGCLNHQRIPRPAYSSDP